MEKWKYVDTPHIWSYEILFIILSYDTEHITQNQFLTLSFLSFWSGLPFLN